jgi:hypothetical protein
VPAGSGLKRVGYEEEDTCVIWGGGYMPAGSGLKRMGTHRRRVEMNGKATATEEQKLVKITHREKKL